jgi:hypothetical protein
MLDMHHMRLLLFVVLIPTTTLRPIQNGRVQITLVMKRNHHIHPKRRFGMDEFWNEGA